MFESLILADEGYRLRLLRHYQMFKSVVDDPAHPKRRLLSSLGDSEAPPPARARGASTLQPPPRRFKRRPRR
jgi:hypothetical protein